MPQTIPEPGRLSAARYLELSDCEIISPDDRVELLRGMVVAMAAQSAPHASTVYCVEHVLLRKLGPDVVVRAQMTFVAGDDSVPEPDVAVVPGRFQDYWEQHPSTAHLIVEVAHRSVSSDRMTKSASYARAGVPCYWIVNLRDRCVEVYGRPDRAKDEYENVERATGAQTFSIDAFPGVSFTADELLPSLPGNR